jgi:type I restriction enzyme S subunit
VKAGWRSTTIGDILRLEYGKPLPDAERIDDGLYPIFGANGEKGRTNACYHDQPSIIVGRKGSAGELNLTDGGFWPLDVTYFVKLMGEVDLRFVWYLLTRLNLPSLAKGIKPGINRNEVYAIPVSVPGLKEQERIVAILDEAFEAIATAKANAEKNRQSLSQLENAAGFPREPIFGEKRHTLTDLCEFVVDCEHKTAPTQDTGIPSIRTPNIGRGFLILEGVNRVSEKTYREWTRRAEPVEGDLIFAREAPAGNVAVVPPSTKLCLGQRTVLLRPKHQLINSAFLSHLILHPATQKRWLGHSRGATVQHVNLKDIRALPIGSLPTIEEQLAVVRKIEALTEQLECAADLYTRKMAALEDLKQSFLNQAFTGKL